MICRRSLRDDDVYLANIYRQDYPVLGFNSQMAVVHNRNNENAENYFDNNGFLVRPASLGTEQLRSYQVTYLGYSGDGHFGRNNVSGSIYYAFGDEDKATFTGRRQISMRFLQRLNFRVTTTGYVRGFLLFMAAVTKIRLMTSPRVLMPFLKIR